MELNSRVRRLIRSASTRAKRIESVPTPVLYGSLLEGRRALVTGGTSGIGKAIAEAFARNGASVVITGRNKERAASVAKQLASICPNSSIFGVALDVRDASVMVDAVGEAAALLDGTPDILVNSAGVNGGGSLGSITAESFDEVLDTNLRGTALLSQVVARMMVSAGVRGNILNVSSSSALRPANTPYIMSKWGVRGLTLGMAKTLAPHDIVVNALAPGPTATPMLLANGSDDISKPKSPVGRYATPEEIANMAVVLVSDVGRMVVGDTLYMTGGSGLITFDDAGSYDFRM